VENEIKAIAKEIRDGLVVESGLRFTHLRGFCAIFTARMVKCLRPKYNVEWHMNDCHCFPVVDGVVYDGTAKQFDVDYPQVLVSDHGEIDRQHPFGRVWTTEHRGKNEKEFVATLKKVGWPVAQTPRLDGGLRAVTRKHGVFHGC
jgi:hypothetical protein